MRLSDCWLKVKRCLIRSSYKKKGRTSDRVKKKTLLNKTEYGKMSSIKDSI